MLLSWPLSVRPRHYDRFVLIGLCWLYGRSEFPPPPPPPPPVRIRISTEGRKCAMPALQLQVPSDLSNENCLIHFIDSGHRSRLRRFLSHVGDIGRDRTHNRMSVLSNCIHLLHQAEGVLVSKKTLSEAEVECLVELIA